MGAAARQTGSPIHIIVDPFQGRVPCDPDPVTQIIANRDVKFVADLSTHHLSMYPLDNRTD